MLCVQLSATTQKRIATEHQETSTFSDVIYAHSSAIDEKALRNSPWAICCGVFFKFRFLIFWNVVTEFSCALGSWFVIECLVHLQQSHFCHHKVFILKKQNHKDHKTQGRHRGGSAETKELFSQMLNQSILPSLWGNSISWLLFTFLQSWTKETGLTNVIIVDTNFIQCIAISVAKAKEKKRNVNNSIHCFDEFNMFNDFFKWVTLNSFCSCCDFCA